MIYHPLKLVLLATTSAMLLTGLSTGNAAVITVINPGFDQLFTASDQTTPYSLAAGNGTYGMGTTPIFFDPNTTIFVSGWTSYFGSQTAALGVISTTGGSDVFAYLNTGGDILTQSLNVPLLADSIYTVSFQKAGVGAGYLQFYAGNTALTPFSAVTPAPVADEFVTWTYQFNSADLGNAQK